MVKVTGASSADAIEQLFRKAKHFKLDCASAMVVVWYKASLETLVALDPTDGRKKFDKMFPTIVIGGIYSTKPPLRLLTSADVPRMGDAHWLRNSQFSDVNFQGENFFQLADGKLRGSMQVFAHPFGKTTYKAVYDAVLAARKEGATIAPRLDPEGWKRLIGKTLDTAAGTPLEKVEPLK